MNDRLNQGEDEAAVRGVIEAWADAVRRRDIAGILQNHAPDIVMFDVPPPLRSDGIEAYRKTWDTFFGWSNNPIPFDFASMDVVAGREVAFCFATLHCAEPGEAGEHIPLDFRLTIGLRKIDGRWTIMHEHHSVPATD